jgi:hypothetical protein
MTVNANRYGYQPSLDHNGQQSWSNRLAAPSISLVADSCVRGPTTISSNRRTSLAITKSFQCWPTSPMSYSYPSG